MYFKTNWRFWKNLISEGLVVLGVVFLHNIDILIENTISRPNTGFGGKNYLKNCKLTKLQRHKCAGATLPAPLRLSGAFPPFFRPPVFLPSPAASAGLSRPFLLSLRPGAASAPVPPAFANRPAPQQKHDRLFLKERANSSPAAQRLSRCSSSGSSEGRKVRSVPHKSTPALLLVKHPGV